MRAALWFAILAACYAPLAPTGAPCDPGSSTCPSGQHCVDVGGGFSCTAMPGLGTFDGGADGPYGVDASVVDAAPDAPALPIQRTYTATVAECIDPNAPNPAVCRNANGVAQLAVDLKESGASHPWEGFVRFDLDAAILGKTVTSVKLQMTATNHSNASGPDSGDVYRVSAFTLASLGTTAPIRIDLLAGTRGPVAQLDVIEWSLPANVVAPSAPVFLGIMPNDENGVLYSNLDGPQPPRLIIDAQ